MAQHGVGTFAASADGDLEHGLRGVVADRLQRTRRNARPANSGLRLHEFRVRRWETPDCIRGYLRMPHDGEDEDCTSSVGMIDLHCHRLPGLDDGALDLQDSLEMARQAQDDGVTVVCEMP
jgi:Capsular polysaccharide synthesis, CpsB/CapC